MSETPKSAGADGGGPASLESRAKLRGRIDRLSIGSLIHLVTAAILVLSAIAMLAAAIVVAWLRDADTDHQQWTTIETQLQHVHTAATGSFLDLVKSMADNVVASEAVALPNEDLAVSVDELVDSTRAISDDPRFETLGTSLRAAAVGYTDAARVAANAQGVSLLGSRGELTQLEHAFSQLLDSIEDFDGAMSEAQSEGLNRHTGRANAALVVLTISFGAAGAIVITVWQLGRRAQRREKALLSELSNEKILLQTIIDALPESVVWKDIDSNVLGRNAAMTNRMKINDMTPPPNGRVSDCTMPDDLAQYVRTVEALESEVMESGIAITGRRMDRPEPDGSASSVLRTAIPLSNDGQIVGVLSTTRDITPVVQLERSLASASRLESIGQLSAGVAHEINTPVQFVSDNTAFLSTSFKTLLGAIDSLTQLAEAADPAAVAAIKKEADLDFLIEDIPDAVDQSLDGLRQITQIVKAMKAFAHPGGEIVATDLNELIASTVDVSRNEWKYNATVELDLAEDLPEVRCDEGQIKQALLNLVVNAAHAIADDGGELGTITITTRATEQKATIQVSDTGTGISDEVQKRMFERFFTTKEVGRGSGQGLAIAYDAVTAHGGEISVDSTLGEGTTFTMEIPINPPIATEEPAADLERSTVAVAT